MKTFVTWILLKHYIFFTVTWQLQNYSIKQSYRRQCMCWICGSFVLYLLCKGAKRVVTTNNVLYHATSLLHMLLNHFTACVLKRLHELFSFRPCYTLQASLLYLFLFIIYTYTLQLSCSPGIVCVYVFIQVCHLLKISLPYIDYNILLVFHNVETGFINMYVRLYSDTVFSTYVFH